MDHAVWGEEKGRHAAHPSPAAVSSMLFLLPSSQDDANYLSGSFPIAQAWKLPLAPDPGCGAHSLRTSLNPAKYAEELAPSSNTGNTEVSLSPDGWWPRFFLGRDAGPGLSILVRPFGPQSRAVSLPCHLLAKAGSEQRGCGREVPTPRLQAASLLQLRDSRGIPSALCGDSPTGHGL